MLFMLFVYAVGLGLVVLAMIRMYGGHEKGDEGPGGEDGPGWRRGGGPGPGGPRPFSPEPTWWPEFEREFRVYASTQASSRKLSGIGS